MWWGRVLSQWGHSSFRCFTTQTNNWQLENAKEDCRTRVSISRKGNQFNRRTSDVYIVRFLTVFSWYSDISCCNGVTGYWFPSVKRQEAHRSTGQSFDTPVRDGEIRVGDDLRVMIQRNKDKGIVHALQPGTVQEIIARICMRWWNTLSSQVAGSAAIPFMELLDAPAIHLAYVLEAFDGISTGGLFNWKPETGKNCAYSLENEDCPRLPLFTRKGPTGSTALLNPRFWLLFDELSTWRSILQLYCSVESSLTTRRTWPVPRAQRVLRRWVGPVLNSVRCQKIPRTWSPTLPAW